MSSAPPDDALDPDLAALNELFEACEGLALEPHLQPGHWAVRVDPKASLDVALADAIHRMHGRYPGDLRLHAAGNWRAAVDAAYLFWAGFGPSADVRQLEQAEHRALRQRIVEQIAAVVAADASVFWMESADAEGRSLCPVGGLHQYLVIAAEQTRLLIDFCWDS